jgi:hypothetical protein
LDIAAFLNIPPFGVLRKLKRILFCWHFSCISSDAHPPKYRQQQQHGVGSRQASGGSGSPETTAAQTGTMLSEDYAEIVDEEGDYSTPASE